MRVAAPIVLCSLIAGATACGTSATSPARSTPRADPPRIAVLRPVWVTPDPSSTDRVTRAALDGLRTNRGVQAEAVNAPAPQDGDESPPPCHDDLVCLRSAGAKVKAAKVLVTKLAGLGDTVLVRMSLFDVRGGTHEQTRQSVVRASDDGSVVRSVRTLAQEMGKPFGIPSPSEPPATAWYERWWVWAGAGAIVSASIATPLLLRDDPTQETEPDVVITPP